MLSDGAGRTLGGVWTVNSSTPATATITEILFNLRLGGTVGETFSSTCTAWNTLPAGEALVPRQGGTIIGPLTLSSAPTATLHATTKSYVDTGDAARLPLTGGTLTGALTGTTANFSGQVTIRNGSPTIYLQDTDNKGGAIHCNSDIVYIISCPVDSQTFSTPPNGRWPFQASTSTGDVSIGRNLDVSAGQLTTNNAIVYNGLAWEGSNAVRTYWDGRVRFTHEIGAPGINCENVFADYIRNTSGGAPRLWTADGRNIVFQFVDDWANYVRFFRSDGFTNYLMQSPNMRYMDARDWGGTWAMLVQQNDGANQIFFPAAYSDERLKTNIQRSQVDALAALAAVEVVEYDWNEDGLTIGHIHSQLKHVEIGVIGQQAVEHVPEMFEAGPVPLPSGDTEYRMTFHPEKAVPYLIRAIQQQQDLIVALTGRLKTLEAATSAGGHNA